MIFQRQMIKEFHKTKNLCIFRVGQLFILNNIIVFLSYFENSIQFHSFVLVTLTFYKKKQHFFNLYVQIILHISSMVFKSSWSSSKRRLLIFILIWFRGKCHFKHDHIAVYVTYISWKIIPRKLDIISTGTCNKSENKISLPTISKDWTNECTQSLFLT